MQLGRVCKLLRVCRCGCCPGRLVSFVLDGGCAAEAGVDAAAVVEVFDRGGDLGVDLVAGGEGTPVVVLGCEGGLQGLGHGVIPAHLGLSHRHGSFHRAHVGSQFLGGELCSPISVQHDPCGEGATGGGGHVECGDDQSAWGCLRCSRRPWSAALLLSFPSTWGMRRASPARRRARTRGTARRRRP